MKKAKNLNKAKEFHSTVTWPVISDNQEATKVEIPSPIHLPPRIDSMDRFTTAIKKSLEVRNWYSALYLALTMPDICARLESENGKTNGQKYASWFDRYMLHKYQSIGRANSAENTFLSGNDCYALRCAILHEGTVDITTQRCREALDRFHFTVVGSHCNQFGSVLQLDVPVFCNDICEAIENWLADFRRDHPEKQNRLLELLTIHVGTHTMDGLVTFGDGRTT